MLGRTPDEGRLFGGTQYVGGRLKTRSIFEILHHEGDKLLNDEKFADLYSDRGRRSIPPRIVVTVMILQCWSGFIRSRGGGSVRVRCPLEVRLRESAYGISGVLPHGVSGDAG